MTELSEARAVERATGARHERLCRQFDRGEPVRFALQQADFAWIRAKAALAAAEDAARSPVVTRPTNAEGFAASVIAVCVGSWVALAIAVSRWWLNAGDLNDLGSDDEG